MKTTTLPLQNSVNRSHCAFALLLIPLALTCFALSPQARATCQDGCDSTTNNTFLGESALINNVGGVNNTAVGFNTLLSNTYGVENTAIGTSTLSGNTFGNGNTAIGSAALANNTIGGANTAVGNIALVANTTGSSNTAEGYQALYNSTTGSGNAAFGRSALKNNNSGTNNTALGFNALIHNSTGSSNIGVGPAAGFNLTTGNNNIDIGNNGVATESNTIRIGTTGTHANTYIAGVSDATVPTGIPVIVDTTGHLGTTTSSARFKEAIRPMDKASEAILALKPVTFRYKHDLDPDGIPQFGLVAEEVEKVSPDLVARDNEGKPYTVRYEAVNAMLLNEFLKEHREVQEQKATIAEFKKEIANLTATVKQQSAQIQKVSAQFELSKAAPQTVLNDE